MIADPIMTALLQMFTSSTGQGGGVQEDALMAVGTLVEGRCYHSHMYCGKNSTDKVRMPPGIPGSSAIIFFS